MYVSVLFLVEHYLCRTTSLRRIPILTTSTWTGLCPRPLGYPSVPLVRRSSASPELFLRPPPTNPRSSPRIISDAVTLSMEGESAWNIKPQTTSPVAPLPQPGKHMPWPRKSVHTVVARGTCLLQSREMVILFSPATTASTAMSFESRVTGYVMSYYSGQYIVDSLEGFGTVISCAASSGHVNCLLLVVIQSGILPRNIAWSATKPGII